MQPKTKKVLIIATIVVVFGGVGYYFWKKKKEGAVPDSSSDTPPTSTEETKPEEKKDTVLKTKNPVFMQPKKTVEKSIPSGVLVSAEDLLAGNLKNAINKEVYAKFDNMPVYNLSNKQSFKTKKGQLLGFGTKAESTKNGIKLYFKGTNGVFYWASVKALNVKN